MAAETLLLHCLERDRAWLYAHGDDEVPASVAADFQALNRRRLRGEPVAYLTGVQDFWSLTLNVGPGVLVPRPDTETLIEWSLDLFRHRTSPRILDLGTGSGAIALALASELTDACVTAADISAEALATARANGERLSLEVQWVESDWFGALNDERWSLIVSNPPYVAEGDPHLASLSAEPQLALLGGTEGLDCVERIVAAAPEHLEPAGWLLVEHGYDQGSAVRTHLQRAGFEGVETRRDLAGRERVSGGYRGD